MKPISKIQNIFSILLGAALTYAGIGHLSWLRREFLAQVPDWLPFDPDLIVLASGVVEILLGVALIVLTKYKQQLGLATAAFFVLVFPGNIAQYVNHVDAFGLDSDQARAIRLAFQPLLVAWALWSTGAYRLFSKKRDSIETKSDNEHFYNFSATSLQGKEVSMSAYQGKTILVVNTASECGLTYQYEGLQELYAKYQDRGLVILGFPSNQFANQEPGDEKAIEQGCVLNYGVTFPMFAKVEVNGKKAHPIFKYLKHELKGTGPSHIKWNFTKFLIDSNGTPIKRFSPTTKPKKVERFLKTILEK